MVEVGKHTNTLPVSLEASLLPFRDTTPRKPKTETTAPHTKPCPPQLGQILEVGQPLDAVQYAALPAVPGAARQRKVSTAGALLRVSGGSYVVVLTASPDE